MHTCLGNKRMKCLSVQVFPCLLQIGLLIATAQPSLQNRVHHTWNRLLFQSHIHVSVVFIRQRMPQLCASRMKHAVVSWPFSHDNAYIQQKRLWFLCTLRLLLCRWRSCKLELILARALALLLLLGGDIESNPGPPNSGWGIRLTNSSTCYTGRRY